MELLLQEIMEFGLDPTNTVACVFEQQRWKGSGRSNPRFADDLSLTLEMITGEKFQIVMAKDNRVLISFGNETSAAAIDNGEEEKEQVKRTKSNPFANVAADVCCTLGEEGGLIKDIASAAHYIDLFGAGRWKFPVNMLSAAKKEQEERRKAEAEAKRKAEAEAKRLAAEAEVQRRAEAKAAAQRAREQKAKEEAEAKAAKEAAEAQAKEAKEAQEAKEEEEAKEDAKEETKEEKDNDAEVKADEPAEKEEASPKITQEKPEGAEELQPEVPQEGAAEAKPAPFLLPEEASPAREQEVAASPKTDQDPASEDVAPKEEHHLEHEDGEMHEFNETAHLVELEAEDEEEHLHEVVEEPEEEEEIEEELGPPINIYKPVTPYEVNWEIVEAPDPGGSSSGGGRVAARPGKVAKAKVIKGRCQWRNPVGFMCSTDVSEAMQYEPWPNDMFAVYTTTQGGDSKDMSWVEGVTLLSSEEHNVIAFVLLMAFLRDHQDFWVDVDLMDGRIYSMKGPGGMELIPSEDQVLLSEDFDVINDLRKALSEAFYSKAPPKITTVEQEEGIDFSGTRGKRDDEPVPQVAAETRVGEALDRLFEVLRESSTRFTSIDEATWNQRIRLSKSNRQVLPVHQESNRKARQGSDELFTLFEPFLNIEEVRAEAERREREEEMRRRQAEEEKRRRKEEERQRKDEERRQKEALKRQQKQLEQQRREEDRRAAKGKGKGKEDGKGKGKKGQKQQQQQYMQQQYAQPQQPRQQQQQQQQQRQAQPKKGKRGEQTAARSSTVDPNTSVLQQPVMVDGLPPPWVGVADPNSGQLYYWNQATNETTWIRPGAPMGAPMMPLNPGFQPFFYPQ